MSQKLSLKIHGMHCPACETLVLDAATETGAFESCAVKLSTRSLEATLGSEANIEGAKSELEAKLKPLGYSIYQNQKAETLKEYLLGASGAVVFLALYLVINNLGIKSQPTEFSPLSALLIGLIASISTCFALVGGVMITYFSSVSASNPKLALPAQVSFHGGRVASFLVGGAILGFIGDQADLDGLVGSPMILVAGIAMLVFSLQLLGVLPALKLGSTKPKKKLQKSGKVIVGLLVGALTILLPCSFTLIVMIEALGSGSALGGVLLMGAFVLGTLPVLGISGLFLGKLFQGKFAVYLRRGSGFLVLGFGILQIVNWISLVR